MLRNLLLRNVSFFSFLLDNNQRIITGAFRDLFPGSIDFLIRHAAVFDHHGIFSEIFHLFLHIFHLFSGQICLQTAFASVGSCRKVYSPRCPNQDLLSYSTMPSFLIPPRLPFSVVCNHTPLINGFSDSKAFSSIQFEIYPSHKSSASICSMTSSQTSGRLVVFKRSS